MRMRQDQGGGRQIARRLLGILGWNAAAAATAYLLLMALGDPEWSTRLAVTTFVYSNCIGTLIGLAFQLTPLAAAATALRFPLNWALLVGAVSALATVGCLAAVTILAAIGVVPPSRVWGMFADSVAFSIGISLVFGVSGFLYEALKGRLERAELDHERANTLLVEARLSSLESRVQPHFLFNTLNSISALIREDPARAEATVERLAELLRFSLDADARRTVPLGRELAVVRDYLEIERTRYGERLRYALDVPTELESVELPALLLQTIVENSVKHAIAPRPGGGELSVSARDAGDAVEIEVSDDGPGLAAGPFVEGHGLANARDRLAALYGAAGSLGLARASDRTVVTVRVPRDGRGRAV